MKPPLLLCCSRRSSSEVSLHAKESARRLIASGSWAISKFLLCQSGHRNLRRCAHFVDDLNQPVDKASAAKFDRIIAGLLQRVADDVERPRWKDESFFKRFAK